MNDSFNLDRFKTAQSHDYQNALREIRNGKKITHWMWYIFPQASGLGISEMAEYYGIRSLEEAKAFLDDPILGPRLVEISTELMRLEDKNAEQIFGFPDYLKLRSSMTLFAAISDEGSIFHQVLDAYYDGKRDERTLELIRRSKNRVK